MTSATEPQLEQDLVEFLNELSELQQELLTVLQEKREHLARGNLAGIEEVQPREEVLISKLNHCHHQRQLLLDRAHEQGLGSNDLGSLAETIQRTEGPALSEQVRTLNARMRMLQNGTLTNWLLAQRSLLHLSQLVEIIATGGKMQPTYVMGEAVHARGALLDQEA